MSEEPALALVRCRVAECRVGNMGKRTSSSQQASEDSPRRQILRTFAVQAGPPPFGISVSPTNIVTFVDPEHPEAGSLWREGDALIWVDGVEVRGGSCTVPEALQKDKEVHTFIVQRMAPEILGKMFFSLRIQGNPLGIRLTSMNHVLHLDEGSPSALDGRLQVCAMQHVACCQPRRCLLRVTCSLLLADGLHR